jgi:hypothetical protein
MMLLQDGKTDEEIGVIEARSGRSDYRSKAVKVAGRAGKESVM